MKIGLVLTEFVEPLRSVARVTGNRFVPAVMNMKTSEVSHLIVTTQLVPFEMDFI